MSFARKTNGLLKATIASLSSLSIAAEIPPRAPPTVERGVVTAVGTDTVTLKTDAGMLVTLTLGKDWRLTVLKPVQLDSIRAGSFIGTTEMPQKDGVGRSLEVHVFPPGVKVGEGHFPWDTKPGAMMTNGTVGKVTASASGRELQVSYPNGQRTIVVPPNAPIVMLTDGTRDQLKPGIPADLMVMKSSDGGSTVGNVMIDADGTKPTM